MTVLSETQFFERLDALVEPLAGFRLGPHGSLGTRQQERAEAVAAKLQAVCFEEPGIGDPQYADRAALTAAQLEPARRLRRWLARQLAATDWADARQARRAWVLWHVVLDSWEFSDWGLPLLLPGEDGGLAEAVAGLLNGPNYALPNDVRLSDVLYAIAWKEVGQPAAKNAGLLRLLPRLLRFGPGDNGSLALLPLHADAAEEVPRLLHDAFATPEAAWVQGYVMDWLREAPVVKLLKPALPRLRHYLGQLTQPQLTALTKQLNLQQVLNDYLSELGKNEVLDSFAKSPNRLALLALLAELAAEPALVALTQAALARAQARRAELAASRPPRPAKAKSTELADFALKLLVVSELLRQGEDFPELAAVLARQHHPTRYGLVKRAVAAYRRLQLTPAHYDQVEELQPDGTDIYELNMTDNWNFSDEFFEVRSLAGIGLLRNLRVFSPISLVTVNDFTPLLDCPKLEEAGIAALAGADSVVALALEARGVRVF